MTCHNPRENPREAEAILSILRWLLISESATALSHDCPKRPDMISKYNRMSPNAFHRVPHVLAFIFTTKHLRTLFNVEQRAWVLESTRCRFKTQLCLKVELLGRHDEQRTNADLQKKILAQQALSEPCLQLHCSKGEGKFSQN